jgi:hypothetical protein
VVRLLLSVGAKATAKDKKGNTPLHLVADNVKAKEAGKAVAELLTEAGADIDAANGEGKTPLHRAVEKGETVFVAALLQLGADTAKKDKQGKTPIDRIENNAKPITKLFDRFGRTKLSKERDETVQKLKRYERVAFLPKTRSGDGAAKSKFGGSPWLEKGEPWPVCPGCGAPATLFLQLNTGQLPKGAAPKLPKGLIQVFYCVDLDCPTYEDAFLSGGPLLRWIEPSALKKGAATKPPKGTKKFPAKEISGWEEHPEFPGWSEQEEVLKLTDPERQVIQSLEQPSSKDKLLGWPDWVQSADYVTCSKCNKEMGYVFQIASKDHVSFVFGDMGIAHLFQCAKHPQELFFQWAGT